jgi:diacylglycerol kinase
VVLVLGVWLDINGTEWCLVSLAVAMVMGAEALNTGIELAVDLGPVKVARPTRTGGRG